MRYSIVLFKDKSKKKIIKKFVSFQKANLFFEKLIGESSSIKFEVRIENAKECKYDLALIDSNPKEFNQIYFTDEFGRNIKVKLEDNKQSIVKILQYRKEELIQDLQTGEKINFEKILNKYLRNQNLKMMYSLNNKIIIQDEEKVFLFSLKNPEESLRFLSVISDYFLKNKRSDCLFIKDNSKPQKKYLYDLLEKKGWKKSVLYRGSTTYRTR